jgi:hypothetical protein
MASSIQELVNAVSSEMASGIGTAVECWLAEVEQAIQNPRATAMERIEAAKEVVSRFKRVSGKSQLELQACSQAHAV